jgi:hypothetical protein
MVVFSKPHREHRQVGPCSLLEGHISPSRCPEQVPALSVFHHRKHYSGVAFSRMGPIGLYVIKFQERRTLAKYTGTGNCADPRSRPGTRSFFARTPELRWNESPGFKARHYRGAIWLIRVGLGELSKLTGGGAPEARVNSQRAIVDTGKGNVPASNSALDAR